MTSTVSRATSSTYSIVDMRSLRRLRRRSAELPLAVGPARSPPGRLVPRRGRGGPSSDEPARPSIGPELGMLLFCIDVRRLLCALPDANLCLPLPLPLSLPPPLRLSLPPSASPLPDFGCMVARFLPLWGVVSRPG